MRHAIFVAVLVTTIPAFCVAQVPNAADGPWSGQVQCVLSARGLDYQDDQTHTWRLTGGTPEIAGMFRKWPGVWSVQGNGTRRLSTTPLISPRAKELLGSPSETWKTTVPETTAPISMWEPSPGRLRIGSQHGLLTTNGAITGTASTGAAINAPLEEWEFPVVEDVATLTTISGTRTRNVPNSRGWRQPTTVLTTETCTWNFAKRAAPQGGLSLSGATVAPGATTEAAIVAPVLDAPLKLPPPSAPSTPPESAFKTAPVNAPVAATAHTVRFTPPTGGHMEELWSKNSTSAVMVLVFRRADVQSDGRIYSGEFGLGNILPGRYGTLLSLQCGAGQPVHVELSSFTSTRQTIKTWDVPASQPTSQTREQKLTFEQTVDLTSSRSSLTWTVSGFFCAFSDLLVWDAATP